MRCSQVNEVLGHRQVHALAVVQELLLLRTDTAARAVVLVELEFSVRFQHANLNVLGQKQREQLKSDHKVQEGVRFEASSRRHHLNSVFVVVEHSKQLLDYLL